jgi:hypothetical protein
VFTAIFWKQTGERAAKSAAQALIGLWALDGVFNILTVNWPLAGGVAAGAAALSVLTSVVSAGAGQPDSPSLVSTDPQTAPIRGFTR